MPTKYGFETLTPLNTTVLTTDYGTKGGTGWISNIIDSSRYDYLMFEWALTWAAATNVKFKFLFGDNSVLPTIDDATMNNLAVVQNQNANPLVDDEPFKNTGGASMKFGMFFDCRGKSRLIILAKGASANGDVLTGRWLGYRISFDPPIQRG